MTKKDSGVQSSTSMTHRFGVKPLSANRMFYRAKTKTKEYREYQETIRMLLMMENNDTWDWPFGTNKVSFKVEAGLSNKAADLDNVIKPLLDTYQSMYPDFNDKYVYYIELTKTMTKRGEEFLEVLVEEIEDEV